MVLDANLKLFEGAVDNAPNTDIYPDANKNAFTTGTGNSLALGRRGLPKGRAQFIVGVDNQSGTAADDPSIVCVLQLSTDGGTTYNNIATIDLGAADEAYQGQKVMDIGLDFAAQEYADANIDLRLFVDIVGVAANNVTADKLWAFIGYGEATHWGLKTGSNLIED